MLFSVILKYFSRPHSFCRVNFLCFLQCVQVPSDSPSQLHPHNSCGTSADIPSGDPGSQTCCNRMKMQHVRIKNTTLKHLPETHITHLQTESRRTPNKTTNHNVWRGRPGLHPVVSTGVIKLAFMSSHLFQFMSETKWKKQRKERRSRKINPVARKKRLAANVSVNQGHFYICTCQRLRAVLMCHIRVTSRLSSWTLLSGGGGDGGGVTGEKAGDTVWGYASTSVREEPLDRFTETSEKCTKTNKQIRCFWRRVGTSPTMFVATESGI